MTIDEAIKNREECLKYLEVIGKNACPECVEAMRWSVKALKAMKSENSYSPGHIDRETWEPCLFCCEKTKGRKTLAFDSAGDAVTIEIDGTKAAIESDSMGFIVKFCPECGRPLTDEAWNELEKRLRW